jgi:hypothetical protein
VREITKLGQPVIHCRLEDGNLTQAVPRWMFDEALCASFELLDDPHVHWRALRELARLLQDTSPHLVEQGHSTTVPGGNARELSEVTARRRSVESVSPSADASTLGSTAGETPGSGLRTARSDADGVLRGPGTELEAEGAKR